MFQKIFSDGEWGLSPSVFFIQSSSPETLNIQLITTNTSISLALQYHSGGTKAIKELKV